MALIYRDLATRLRFRFNGRWFYYSHILNGIMSPYGWNVEGLRLLEHLRTAMERKPNRWR